MNTFSITTGTEAGRISMEITITKTVSLINSLPMKILNKTAKGVSVKDHGIKMKMSTKNSSDQVEKLYKNLRLNLFNQKFS